MSKSIEILPVFPSSKTCVSMLLISFIFAMLSDKFAYFHGPWKIRLQKYSNFAPSNWSNMVEMRNSVSLPSPPFSMLFSTRLLEIICHCATVEMDSSRALSLFFSDSLYFEWSPVEKHLNEYFMERRDRGLIRRDKENGERERKKE